jgi:hypothetical protein
MAKMYGTRPSEILGVSDPYAAFCLDHALFAKLTHFLAEENGERTYRPQGYDPPAKDVLTRIPWQGDGPDPLSASGRPK